MALIASQARRLARENRATHLLFSVGIQKRARGSPSITDGDSILQLEERADDEEERRHCGYLRFVFLKLMEL